MRCPRLISSMSVIFTIICFCAGVMASSMWNRCRYQTFECAAIPSEYTPLARGAGLAQSRGTGGNPSCQILGFRHAVQYVVPIDHPGRCGDQVVVRRQLVVPIIGDVT